jgi:hypothetical protein
VNRTPRNRNQRRRGGNPNRPKPVDVWSSPRPLPDIEKIAPASEAGAMLRSLGDPPMNNGTAAGHYFHAVIERAAAVASALAMSADLLAAPGADED